jgi:hypothetical protein
VTQHKSSKTLAFKPLARALGEPGEFLLSDFSKVGVQGGSGVVGVWWWVGGLDFLICMGHRGERLRYGGQQGG